MLSRRDAMVGALALVAASGSAGHGAADPNTALARTAAGRFPDLETLVGGKPRGRRITLLHLPDLHAALFPQYLRPMASARGDGAFLRRPPLLTGAALARALDLPADSPLLPALDHEAFARDALALGPMGGVDRIAAAVAAVKALNPEGFLLLGGGDGWQGSALALADGGAGMTLVEGQLGIAASVPHWELIQAPTRLAALPYPLLAGNLEDSSGARPLKPETRFDRFRARIGVMGAAYPHLAAAHGAKLAGGWRSGIDLNALFRQMATLKQSGHGLVVLLSHCGFDADLEIATRVPGIDIILSAHSHHALPEPILIGRTIVCVAGSHGRFLGRLDVDFSGGEIQRFEYHLIPIYAEAIPADGAMAQLAAGLAAAAPAPFAEPLCTAGATMARMSLLPDTADWLIGDALLRALDAEIALTPGHRWGPGVAAGSVISFGDVTGWTAVPGARAGGVEMTGAAILAALEASLTEQLSAPRLARLGEDPLRAIGLTYGLDLEGAAGDRIREPQVLRRRAPLDPSARYKVALWGDVLPLAAAGRSVADAAEAAVAAGRPVAETVAAGLRGRGVVVPPEREHVLMP